MSTRFIDEINSTPIAAGRAENDILGNKIDTTYAKLSDIPAVLIDKIQIDGTEVNQRRGISFKLELFKNCYIRHYKTKTLSEFCDQKLNTPRVFNQSEKRTIDYFFRINKKTTEKIAYLKSRGI